MTFFAVAFWNVIILSDQYDKEYIYIKIMRSDTATSG
jgi:hypothetical protein